MATEHGRLTILWLAVNLARFMGADGGGITGRAWLLRSLAILVSCVQVFHLSHARPTHGA
jgi:hypothetical protein